MSLDRKKLLIAEVKAELWAGRIVRQHEMKFQKLMENVNVPNTQTPQGLQVQGNNPVNQPPAIPAPQEP